MVLGRGARGGWEQGGLRLGNGAEIAVMNTTKLAIRSQDLRGCLPTLAVLATVCGKRIRIQVDETGFLTPLQSYMEGGTPQTL